MRKKLAFGTIVVVVSAGFSVAEVILVSILLSKLGWPRNELGGFVAGLTVLNTLIARFGADRIFKWFGCSQSGRYGETRAKMLANPDGFVADEDVVELYRPRWLTRFGIGMFLACFFSCALILIFDTHRQIIGASLAYKATALFGTMGLLFWLIRNNPIARADVHGILGGPVGFYFRRRMIRWSDIETCEVVRIYDTFGDLVRIEPVFRDAFGAELLKVDLRDTPLAEQERLVKYIKAKLPKSKLEFGEI